MEGEGGLGARGGQRHLWEGGRRGHTYRQGGVGTGELSQLRGSNSSAVNSEIGTCGHGGLRRERSEDPATPPTHSPVPQAAEPAGATSPGAHTCLSLLGPQCLPGRKAREKKETMEPDGTQIKLDPR